MTGVLGPRPEYIYASNNFPSLLPDMHNYAEQQVLALSPQGACCEYSESLDAEPGHTFPNSFGTTVVWQPGGNFFGGSNNVTFTQDVIVETGCRLTVNNMVVRFAPNARLIVRRGGYAKFDNCLLTSLPCANLRWPGVRVEGTPGVINCPSVATKASRSSPTTPLWTVPKWALGVPAS